MVRIFTKDIGEVKERKCKNFNYVKQLEEYNEDYIKMELKIK